MEWEREKERERDGKHNKWSFPTRNKVGHLILIDSRPHCINFDVNLEVPSPNSFPSNNDEYLRIKKRKKDGFQYLSWQPHRDGHAERKSEIINTNRNGKLESALEAESAESESAIWADGETEAIRGKFSANTAEPSRMTASLEQLKAEWRWM